MNHVHELAADAMAANYLRDHPNLRSELFYSGDPVSSTDAACKPCCFLFVALGVIVVLLVSRSGRRQESAR